MHQFLEEVLLELFIKLHLENQENLMHSKYSKNDSFNLQEIQTLKKFSFHPNIIKILVDLSTKTKQAYLMEYFPLGSLRSFLKKTKDISFQTRFNIMSDICTAVATIHKSGRVIHDLNCDNVLVTIDQHAKLCDLGLVEKIPKNNYEEYALDIRYLGIIFWEIGFNELYEKCTCEDPLKRPTISQVQDLLIQLKEKMECEKKPKKKLERTRSKKKLKSKNNSRSSSAKIPRGILRGRPAPSPIRLRSNDLVIEVENSNLDSNVNFNKLNDYAKPKTRRALTPRFQKKTKTWRNVEETIVQIQKTKPSLLSQSNLSIEKLKEKLN
ncbi:mitogen-activated protein kinase kinase kinase 20-related [Anaeramoeba ignava]|uniref:Mitogen-activated protein kinase kinase kinase 20-related n=1 Tax=Anaeramoeba ignava TaxID=1746090 RepID=A0A9Q0LJG2_ANAIG|nr:mitogen-activated protein kinase kinase kinase 20-related [Anaeramoeba ignava]